MESVENLVVGEEACLDVVVDKSLVERTLDGSESDVVATVVEDVFEAIGLVGRIAEDIETVAVADVAREAIGYEVEILVIEGLWRAVEIELGVCLQCCHAIDRSAILDNLELHQSLAEGLAIDHMVHGIAVALVGDDGCRRDGRRGDGFDARHEPTDRLTDDDGLLVDEVEK